MISRTSTEAYRDTAKSIAQIGTELNVDLIVEGSVTKAGEQVRVVIQLIEAKSDEHLWARTYDRSKRDVLAQQSELAREIAKSLKAAINPEHEVRLATPDALDPAVYDLYLRVVQCRAGTQLRDRAASRRRRPRSRRCASNWSG